MKIRRFLSKAVLLFPVLAPLAVLAAPISGDVRGVTFFYLDGVMQDFPWVLQNQSDPYTLLKINNLLGEYRRAGINWVRLLVAGDHRTEWRSPPSAATVASLNSFLSKLNDQGLRAEVVLVPPTDNNLFDPTNGFASSKAWLDGWLSQINYTNVGMVMLGGDLGPCTLSGCEGDANADALPKNHGAFVREIWAWKKAKYPSLNASYEVLAVQGNDPKLIAMLSRWADRNTPDLGVFAASLYVTLPTGSLWTDYASLIDSVLKSYHSVAPASRALWIDEYGASYKSTNAGNARTEDDQHAAYDGILGASVCWNQKRYAKFAWVGGRDWPYTGLETFQLVRSYTAGGKPEFTPAWSTLSAYYNLTSCP